MSHEGVVDDVIHHRNSTTSSRNSRRRSLDTSTFEDSFCLKTQFDYGDAGAESPDGQTHEQTMQENSPSPHLHYPFEHVQSPDRSLSTHHHHTIRDDGRETHDMGSAHIVDGLTEIFAGLGWSTQEYEGPSNSRKSTSSKSEQVSGVASSSQDTSKDSPDVVQAQRSPGATPDPERTSQASFTDKYGKFIKVVHYNKTSTVQLYEKRAAVTELISSPTKSPTKSRRNSMFTKLRRASMPKATIRELYAVKMFHHTKPDSRQVLRSRDRSGDSPLSHPNIVSIIDVLYNKQGNLCLVMPFCMGGNLHTFLQQETKAKEYLPVEEVNCLGIQILRAVGFLHEWGIAHGDLRPEHVLLTGRGAIKVGGFGEDVDAVRELVRLLNDGNFTSSTSGLKPEEVPGSNSKPLLCIHRGVSELSTPYLPPERFSSRRDSVRQGYTHQHIYDIRAGDIWTCGMIYMLLRAGQLPWRSAQRIDPKKSYSEYLHSRLKEDGYGPIQALENVSFTWRLMARSLTGNNISNFLKLEALSECGLCHVTSRSGAENHCGRDLEI